MGSTRRTAGTLVLTLAVALLVTACGGGGGGGGSTGGSSGSSGELALLEVDVAGQSGVPLNRPIIIEFTSPVDPTSVTPQTLRVRTLPQGATQVEGEVEVDGDRVAFYPRLPTSSDLGDSGLRAGESYEVRVIGHPEANPIRDLDGRGLVETYAVTFQTATAADSLFYDTHPEEPPHVRSVTPIDGAEEIAHDTPIEIRFNEPIHPASVTASYVRLLLVERPVGNPVDRIRPIRGTLSLAQDRDAASVRFHPMFPLADDARYRIEVQHRVTDLAGNDCTPFSSTFTVRDEAPIDGEFVLAFGDGSEAFRDDGATTASWNVDRPGALSGLFTAGGGDGTDGDFLPDEDVTLSSDDRPDGIYNFRRFEVPAHVTVRLVGSRPVTLRAIRGMRIDGTLDASGGKGRDSETQSNTAAVPATPGGQPGPGGGAGGSVATDVPTKKTSKYSGNVGQDGGDGWNAPGSGGEAATWGSVYNYKSAAGGGGGGHRTVGGDGKASTNGSSVRRGSPGAGGGTGGNIFLDPITGGGGGGAGGNGWYDYTPYSQGAGAGGGGGGAVRLETAGSLEMYGHLLARGGDGGSVLIPSNSYSSAGGGGGAGGALLLRSSRDIALSGGILDVTGGLGGLGGARYGGAGGDGGAGWIRLEDADGLVSLAGASTTPALPYRGQRQIPAGAPTVARTVWIDLGVFDPELRERAPEDLVAVTPRAGQNVVVEIQTAPEDANEFDVPDESRASAWMPIGDLQALNGQGHRFLRLRFTLEIPSDQAADDPLPFVDSIRVRFTF
jgi:hypothetical protein